MPTPERYLIVLEAEPGWVLVDDEGETRPHLPIVRLRAALKRLLRTYGLRCVRLQEVHESQPPSPDK